MININNTEKKGIYKNLYSAIQTQNTEKDKANTTKRGIYKDLYPAIENSRLKREESFTSLSSSLMSAAGSAAEASSIWHKYPLKLLVYSNDVGEAARPILGNVLAKLSWLPAILYTVFAFNSGKKKEGLAKEITFQTIASFIIPFLTLKGTRAAASKAIKKLPVAFKQNIKTKTAQNKFLENFINKFKNKEGSGYRNLVVSAASMGVLGATVKPIDKGVKNVLDNYWQD